MLWNMNLLIKKKKTFFFSLFIFIISSLFINGFAYSQSDTSISNSCGSYSGCENLSCSDYIACLNKKNSDALAQDNTLSSQIAIMDSQIRLTEARIEANKREILDLTLDIDTATKKILTLSESLDKITGVLLNRIVATYEVGTIQPLEILLSSNNASNFLARLNYLRIVQAHDKRLIYDVQQAKNDYTNQKDIYEAKKKKVEDLKIQLEAYTNQLNQEKATEQDLLVQTQGKEEVYQNLLAQAKAQLAAFSNFTAGAASILSNQTVCDDGWSGCYYNQRDSQWGTLALNNTQYSIAGDGCLMTSMAMIYTHYGHKSVTPISINSNSNNFASYFPAYLKYTITADGATSNRVGAIIDNTLSSGDPVVVGISYDGGPVPDHFVVLISGSGGNYKMNDPFVPNGHNISFTDHYSIGSIREINKVIF
jgi:peptidoglycan hydrolase CwlO-like protein